MIETVYHRTPADELIDREESRAKDEVRAAREKCLELLNAFAVEIEEVLNLRSPTVGEIAAAFYGPAFALGLMAIGGASMTETAARFAITRASISKRAVNFSRREARVWLLDAPGTLLRRCFRNLDELEQFVRKDAASGCLLVCDSEGYVERRIELADGENL